MTERLGRYYVVEGGDGVGKSTLVHGLADRARTLLNLEVITIEEPDGALDNDGNSIVPISVELRKIIKAKEYTRDPLTNVLLFNASRRENLQQAIRPALARGAWVLSARNFNSTFAYQGYGQGWDISEIERMVAETTGQDYMQPDETFVLDLPESERQLRIAKREGRTDLDTFESLPNSFHEVVAHGYRELASERGYTLVDANPSADKIIDTVWDRISRS